MRLTRPAKPSVRPFTAHELLRIAWNPSSRAPRAADVLTPQPADSGAKELLRDGVLSGRAFISLGAELFRQTPLREVRLVAVQPFMGELARCSHLSKLHRLDLTGNRIGDAGWGELAASEYVGELRELGLSGNDIGIFASGLGCSPLPRGGEEVGGAATPGEGVELHPSSWSDAGREAPSLGHEVCPTSPPALRWGRGEDRSQQLRFENLTVLELADNRLAAVPDLSHLTTLDVSRNPLRSFDFPLGLRCLKASGCGLPVESLRPLQSLVELDASFNALGTDGAESLAEFPARWRRLDLSFNDIESVESLAFADSMASLVSLNLSANRIDSTAALAESPYLGAVEELFLAGNPIGDRGAVALLRGEAFASLTRLDVSNCGITDVAGLCATGALGGLRTLSLAWNPFGDVRAIARCPDLAGLRELDLTGTRLSFAGAIALAESPHLANLRCLKLGENPRLPADAVGMLRERFGTITA